MEIHRKRGRYNQTQRDNDRVTDRLRTEAEKSRDNATETEKQRKFQG